MEESVCIAAGLERCFKPFGPVRVEWPGKDGKHPRFGSKDIRGYAYLLFESDKCVKALLDNCSRDVLGGEYYYKVPSKRLPGKKVSNSFVLDSIMIISIKYNETCSGLYALTKSLHRK